MSFYVDKYLESFETKEDAIDQANLNFDELPIEKTLGVFWASNFDTFLLQFNIGDEFTTDEELIPKSHRKSVRPSRSSGSRSVRHENPETGNLATLCRLGRGTTSVRS